MALRVHGTVAPDRVATLTDRLDGLGTLERVIRALEGEELYVDDAIAMDEFTIDLIVALPDGLTLVFDTT